MPDGVLVRTRKCAILVGSLLGAVLMLSGCGATSDPYDKAVAALEACDADGIETPSRGKSPDVVISVEVGPEAGDENIDADQMVCLLKEFDAPESVIDYVGSPKIGTKAMDLSDGWIMQFSASGGPRALLSIMKY